MRNLYFVLLFALLIVTACSPEQDPRRRKFISDELKNRKIKRVTDSQLLGAANGFGKTAVDKLQTELLNNYEAGKPFDCQANSYIKAKLNLQYVLTYRIVCQAQQALFEKEKQLWQAYEYNTQKELELTDNLQKIDGEAIIYTSPITLNGQLVGMWTVVLDKKEIVKNL
jgi:hypothetical protein